MMLTSPDDSARAPGDFDVNALTKLQRELLQLGLEDLIPLPEAFYTSDDETTELTGTVDDFRVALSELLRLGLIQVWSGHWESDPVLLSTEDAQGLLRVDEQYIFSSPADLRARAYFANVENIRG